LCENLSDVMGMDVFGIGMKFDGLKMGILVWNGRISDWVLGMFCFW